MGTVKACEFNWMEVKRTLLLQNSDFLKDPKLITSEESELNWSWLPLSRKKNNNENIWQIS